MPITPVARGSRRPTAGSRGAATAALRLPSRPPEPDRWAACGASVRRHDSVVVQTVALDLASIAQAEEV